MKKFIKQAEALEQLLNHCTTEGDSYQPSDDAMNSTALHALLEESKKSIQAVHKAKNDLVDATNLRHRAFDPLPILATRVIRALKAVNASPDLIADVNRIRLRFRYQSAGKKPASFQDNPGTIGDGNPSASTPRGPISQLSFGLKQENFAEMIDLLKKASGYAPRESELSIAGLELKLEELQNCNSAVSRAKVTLQTARKKCREMVFGKEGIHGIGMRVKDYYLSVFGYNDEKFRTISKIQFAR